jgi:hypothetical protein
VVVGALHVERISAFEAKHDPILVVDSYRVEPSQISAEGVQSVTGRHLQIVKPSHRVDLIEFAAHVCPELALTAASTPIRSIPIGPTQATRFGPSMATCGGRHAGHCRRFDCANGGTRQELFGIRTEGDRPKFLAASTLGTAKPLPAFSRTVTTAFETPANAGATVVCRAK